MSKKFTQPKTPGPSDYSPHPLIGYTDHQNNSQKPRAPQWTIGQRFNSKLTSNSPSPAAFDVKGFTKTGPTSSVAYSIPQKSKTLKQDKVPGPSYNATDVGLYRWKNEPKFSIPNKSKGAKLDPNPGPAQEPSSTNVFKHQQPQFSIRGKRASLKGDKVPGPQYDVVEAKSRTLISSPNYTHRWKVNDTKSVRTPAPDAYDLRRHNPFPNEPAYTIRTKNSEFAAVTRVPKDNCS